MLQGIAPPCNGQGIPVLCRVADAMEERVWKTHLLLSTSNGDGYTSYLLTAISQNQAQSSILTTGGKAHGVSESATFSVVLLGKHNLFKSMIQL